VFLLTAAAMRVATKGLLTSEIHGDILAALANYTFEHWGISPYTRSGGNGLMDDWTVAAAGHAWAGAYLWYTQASTWNGRDSGWFRSQAKNYIKLSLSPKDTLCVHPLSDAMCASCTDDYNTAYDNDWLTTTDARALRDKIAHNEVEVLNFEHGYENPSYGVGLLTNVSTAVQGLAIAGDPYVPTEFQKVMMHGLFRTGQAHAPSNVELCKASWLHNCVGLSCSMQNQHCLSGSCDPPQYSCDDGPRDDIYTADMFPVKSLLDHQFQLDPSISSLIDPSGYQFTDFCGSRFNPMAGFFNDGRYAAFYQISYQWAYVSQPHVAGVNPVQHTDVPQPAALNPPQPVTGTTTFSGWAFDGEGTLSTASFSFTLDGQPTTLQNLFYGGSRTDVCNYYGLTGWGSCLVGWSGTFTPPLGFTAGNHVFTVTVRSGNGLSTSTFQRTFTYQP